MLIKINFESETPIYEQIKKQIILGIAQGELKRGEELPSVRRLAEDIGINLHTVNKAYAILKEEGYLVLDRRKGTLVKENFDSMGEMERESLKEELEYLIGDSKNKGMEKEDFFKICRDIYDQFSKGEED